MNPGQIGGKRTLSAPASYLHLLTLSVRSLHTNVLFSFHSFLDLKSVTMAKRVPPNKLYDGEVSSTHLPNCKPVNNILFLKTHKMRSNTMTNILNRYGDYRDLLFALPSNPKIYDFDWPRPFRLKYMLSLNRKPNILCNYARYNKAPMNWLFPKETTRYIAMLRDPTEQFKST